MEGPWKILGPPVFGGQNLPSCLYDNFLPFRRITEQTINRLLPNFLNRTRRNKPSFIHSLCRYLLKSHYVPSLVLDIGENVGPSPILS